MNKRELRNARILTPEEQAKIREFGGIPRTEQPRPKEMEPAAIAKRNLTNFLQSELHEIDMSKQATQHTLNRMQSKPAGRLYHPAMKHEEATPQQIEAQEDALLGFTLQSQSLAEGIQALRNDQPLPPDFGATLRILQKNSAKEVERLYKKAQSDPNFQHGYEGAQQHLQALTKTLEQLGL